MAVQHPWFARWFPASIHHMSNPRDFAISVSIFSFLNISIHFFPKKRPFFVQKTNILECNPFTFSGTPIVKSEMSLGSSRSDLTPSEPPQEQPPLPQHSSWMRLVRTHEFYASRCSVGQSLKVRGTEVRWIHAAWLFHILFLDSPGSMWAASLTARV